MNSCILTIDPEEDPTDESKIDDPNWDVPTIEALEQEVDAYEQRVRRAIGDENMPDAVPEVTADAPTA